MRWLPRAGSRWTLGPQEALLSAGQLGLGLASELFVFHLRCQMVANPKSLLQWTQAIIFKTILALAIHRQDGLLMQNKKGEKPSQTFYFLPFRKGTRLGVWTHVLVHFRSPTEGCFLCLKIGLSSDLNFHCKLRDRETLANAEWNSREAGRAGDGAGNLGREHTETSPQGGEMEPEPVSPW